MSERIDFATLRLRLQRQQPGLFGHDYVPAILATREEAPSDSHFSQFYWQAGDRKLHALSPVEANCLFLALLHPGVVDIHEQKLLSPEAAEHPFVDHPLAKGAFQKKVTPGTLRILHDLDPKHRHPSVAGELKIGERKPFSWPYVGDLLLLINVNGQCWCVNWSVKNSADGHEIPIGRDSTNARAAYKLSLRTALERRYYDHLGIPTYQMHPALLDKQLVANLNRIHLADTTITQPLTSDDWAAFAQFFNHALLNRASLNSVFMPFRNQFLQFNFSRRDMTGIVYRLIANRILRVDLYRPLLMDRPLLPEQRDPITEYSTYFKGMH